MDHPDRIEEHMRQRVSPPQNPLATIPITKARGNIPNTPLAVSTIAFLLGSVFSIAALAFVIGGFPSLWWATYQLGFFVAAWAAFHWGEFAVTAGWNFEKCSVDCEFQAQSSVRKGIELMGL